MIDVKRYSESCRQYWKLIIASKGWVQAQPSDATLGVDFGKPIGLKIRTRFQILCGA